jgi:hypothetical protein
MPSSNFCGYTSGFQKYAHVLNKPIGSFCLKYAGTRGGFITISVRRSTYWNFHASKWWTQVSSTLRNLSRSSSDVALMTDKFASVVN